MLAMKIVTTGSIRRGCIGLLAVCLLAAGAGRTAHAQEPGQEARELEKLRQEQRQLQKEVEHYEEEVIHWQAEVEIDPKSLTAPIGLRSARESLIQSKAKLQIVNLRIQRLEEKLPPRP